MPAGYTQEGESMKIKAKGNLKKTLRDESYDIIIFWENGTWAVVSTGYAGEQDGDNPICSIRRSSYYDLTWKEIHQLVRNIEEDERAYLD